MNPNLLPDYLLTRAEVVWCDSGGSDKVYGVAEILCFRFPPLFHPPIHATLPCYLCVAFYGRRSAIQDRIHSVASDITANSNSTLGSRMGMYFGRSERLAKAILELRDNRAPYWWGGGGDPESVDGSAFGRGLGTIASKRSHYDKTPYIHTTLGDAGQTWLREFQRLRGIQENVSPDVFHPTPANVITALHYGTAFTSESVYESALSEWVRQNGGEPPTATSPAPATPQLAPRKFNRRRAIQL